MKKMVWLTWRFEMAFLKNVAVRSNDKDWLLPNDEPTSDAYVFWKDKNYSDELLTYLNSLGVGYRHAYSGHNMYRFWKILKAHGLLGSVAMARPPRVTSSALEIEGEFVYVAGEKIYIDNDGFEL
jgi:hypothetical protein